SSLTTSLSMIMLPTSAASVDAGSRRGASMFERITRFAGAACAAAVVIVSLSAVSVAQAGAVTSPSGTTTDGGTWVADVPSPWNGTLLLYSHGFGPPL